MLQFLQGVSRHVHGTRLTLLQTPLLVIFLVSCTAKEASHSQQGERPLQQSMPCREAPLTLHLLDTGQGVLQGGQGPGAALAPTLWWQPKFELPKCSHEFFLGPGSS